jgi:hypothetical protein
MPYAEAQGERLFVYDQRFGNPLTRGRFDVEIKAAP